MARRFALTLVQLRKLHPAACESDARVLIKDGDEWNMSIKTQHGAQPLYVSGTRELRLLAKQLEWFADYFDRDTEDAFEEMDP